MSNRLISQQSIFGEYKNGEDRVTAALLQLFRLGGPELMNAVFEVFNINLDAQVNAQVKKKGSKSKPDGELIVHYHVYIESKIYPWVFNKEHNVDQLYNHLDLKKMRWQRVSVCFLIYLNYNVKSVKANKFSD